MHVARQQNNNNNNAARHMPLRVFLLLLSLFYIIHLDLSTEVVFLACYRRVAGTRHKCRQTTKKKEAKKHWCRGHLADVSVIPQHDICPHTPAYHREIVGPFIPIEIYIDYQEEQCNLKIEKKN